jgi:putative FmdB family regulatory protein
MPLYEFRCSDCGLFEEWRKLAESSAPAFCPQCAAGAKRVFSAPRIQLNGALRLQKRENPEPQLIQKREVDPEQRSRPKSHGGRPWMINH